MPDRFKFRVWSKTERILYSDLKGIAIYPESITIRPQRLPYYSYEPEDVNIMQCTGLKDSEGNLIFEADIVTSNEASGVFKVVFDNFLCGFFLIGKYNSFNFGNSNRDSLKIIGNIYENPELLEG